jgi:class 3 adenylate cyclase/tetratricopeptide (TPR) repeat protein
MTDAPVKVFVSYSHKDPQYLADESLLGFLKGLGPEENVEFWTDERIAGGSDWNDEIRKRLDSSDIAVVLVSQAFLDSPYCQEVEMESFLGSCRQRGMVIFPIILSPCEWERHAWLATRQFIPSGNETIEEHYADPGKQKRLFLRIRKELREMIRQIRDVRQSQAAAAASPRPPALAEKRQITLLCCELVPREPTGEPLDPEDLAEVRHELTPEFVKASSSTFEKYRGQLLSGGSAPLVCFGYPEVHEDDSLRAVRAGLELQARMKALSARFELELGVALTARIAVHSGTAVLSADRATEDIESSDVGTIVTRLKGEAEPGAVTMTSATRQLVAEFFDVEPAGSFRAGSGAQAIECHRVTADRGFESRFEAVASRGLTPLVGRQKELDLILDQWSGAKRGDGAVVMLSSEAGVGKSRLLSAVHEHVRTEKHNWMTWRCSPYHTDSALHPVIAAFREWAHIAPEDDGERQLARLREALKPAGSAAEELAAILAPALGVPHPAPITAESPQEQKALTMQACAAVVEQLAVHGPAVLVVEDLHWVDPSTSDLLDLVIEQSAGLQLLLLLAYRPEFTPPAGWMSHANVSQIALGKLDRAEVDRMIAYLAGGKALPARLADEIFAKTEGFPLFVEDLTHMVIESDLLVERDGAYELAGPFESLTIPATLYESVMARLARLETAKHVAQIGATIGREFVYDMLRAVASVEDDALKRDLDRLVGAGLLFRRGLMSRAKYIFKHALVQEALHESLLRKQRKQYHRIVADVLEQKFPQVAADEPELVARHLAEAEEFEKSARYYFAAAQKALPKSANLEVLSHTAKALDLLQRLPASPERAELEVDLRCVRGGALVASRGWASPEVRDCFLRARDLCDDVPNSPRLLQVLKGLWFFNLTGGTLDEACALGEEMLAAAQREQNKMMELEAIQSLCAAHFWRGHPSTARDYGYKALEVYDPALHHLEHVTVFGEDPGASIYTYLAMSLAVLGLEEQAVRINGLALDALDVYTQLHSRCFLMAGVLFTNLQMRNAERVMEISEKLLAIATEHHFPAWVGIAVPMRGWAMTALGQVDEGIDLIKRGREGWRAIGGRLHASQWPALLAETYIGRKEYDEAASWLTVGLDDAAQCADRYYFSELWRLYGELALLRDGDEEKAEASFAESATVAASQQALALELRTAVSLGELRLRQGRKGEARSVVEGVIVRFTEGAESWDMRRATEFLQRLTAP